MKTIYVNSKNPTTIADYIEIIETNWKKECQAKKIKNLHLTNDSLKPLYTRVGKIIKENLCGDDEDVELTARNVDEINNLEPKMITKKEEFSESKMTEILNKEAEHIDIQLNIEPPAEIRKSVPKEINWMTNYLKQPKNDRVQWSSKLYKKDKHFSQKSLYDQTEELMDLAADDFANWINALGSDVKSKLNKDLIKQLFSIGIEGDASKALCCEPKQKMATPQEVALSLHMPEVAIERSVARILATDKKATIKKTKNFAFGRTLPPSLCQYKTSAANVQLIKPHFPDELISNKVLFQGITHLRSTKTLLDYLNDKPAMAKPKYLVKHHSKSAQVSEKLKNHIPLYKLV